MVYNIILLRYGEIFLKGRNRDMFERKLVGNIRKLIEKTGFAKPAIIKSRGRLLMSYFPEHAVLRRVFGLVSYSPAVRVEKNTAKIQQKAVELLRERGNTPNVSEIGDVPSGTKGTFRVTTKRSDKSFPITSPDFNRIVGEYVEQNTSLEFSPTSPEITLEIEINQEGAFLFFEAISCSGGLPTGVEGKVLLLIEDEASLLAGLLFMKRGCGVVPVALEEKDISLLQVFCPVELHFHELKDFQELEDFATKKEISILVTGQTLNDKSYNTNLTVMKPLVAYSKKQIQEQLKGYESLV